MKEHWTPSTIGALAVIISGITMRFFGINAEIWSLTLIASGFLFGDQWRITRREVQNRRKK